MLETQEQRNRETKDCGHEGSLRGDGNALYLDGGMGYTGTVNSHPSQIPYL